MQGVFCLSGITGTPHNVQATIDSQENESFQFSVIRAALGRGGTVCPVGTDVTVETSVATVKAGELEEEEVSQGFFVSVD